MKSAEGKAEDWRRRIKGEGRKIEDEKPSMECGNPKVENWKADEGALLKVG